ncbi:hypothetical protein MIR68_008344 [Amoeboaphelidium protococcarum]|nr:hypothetical protein MIR68_008344 [Amoeboaphelidium protococcarum]
MMRYASNSTAQNKYEVKDFLEKIGRNMVQYADKFQSWDDVIAAKSEQLKDAGLNTTDRKYLLHWIDNVKHGIEPYTQDKPSRSPRGPKWRY